MKLHKKHEEEVLRVYDIWLNSYLNGDVETYNLYLDDDYRFIGSTDNEDFLDKNETTKFFAETADQLAGKSEIRNSIRTIESFNELVFITELFDAYFLNGNDWAYYGKFRFTSALKKNKEGWRFVYQHFSTPDTKAQEGETWGTEQIAAENLQLREAIQRRTFELEQKNHELEIEAVLERVRARTMAMQHSEELREVVRVIYEQLDILNFEATACNIIIMDEQSGDMQYWVSGFTQDIYPESYHVPNLDHPYLKAQIDTWKKDDYAVFEYSGKEKAGFDKLFFSQTEFRNIQEQAKQQMKSIKMVKLSTAYFNYGALQVLGPEQLTKENAKTLQRMAKVFEQTYTRFLDLQKAEAQAQEAQIEAALERIRSKSLAMYKTDDLRDVVKVLFEQMQGLSVEMGFGSVSIFIFEEGSRNMVQWIPLPDSILSLRVPYFEHPVSSDLFDAKESGVDYFAKVYTVEEKNSWVEKGFVHTDYKNLPEEFKTSLLEAPGYAMSTTLAKNSGICIPSFLGKIPSTEDVEIMKRVGKVFEQSYIRFLDLKKAEAQAREAQIETALERVRSRTMGMQRSDELGDVATILFKELNKLVNNLWTCGFVLCEKDRGEDEWWLSVENGFIPAFYLPNSGDVTHANIYNAWKNGETYYTEQLEGIALQEHYDWLMNIPASKQVFDDMFANGATLPNWQKLHCAFFKTGYLVIITQVPCPDEEIFKRFAKVFEQTYTRFLDLQKAEAQAREAQIEAALEKVRSRTMAMRSSNKLPEAASLLFNEVQALGIPTWSAGYNILSADKKTAECWMCSEGVIQPPFTLAFESENSIVEQYKFFQSNESFFVQELSGTALVQHYDYMKTVPEIGEIIIELENSGFSLPTHQINHLCKFQQGYLLFITYEQVPDAYDIFKRFTQVFEQTYTRFLDLQKAEAQAREAQIETALERVRARALAMQQPEELKDVAEVLRGEMGLLGIEELETCSIYINDENAENAECWYAIKDVRESEKTLVNDYFKLNLKDTWVGREMLTFYQSDKEQVSVVMTGKPRIEWIHYCEQKSVPLHGYYGEVIPDRTYHLYKFSHGAIGAATPGSFSDENWGLLKRAASVFSLAYSRFKDLTQARIDLQRLKKAKKKAEDALSDLRATQTQLIHAEKMASLGELTAGIAHEIQNPLNFVNNFSELNTELISELKEEIEKGDKEEAIAIADDIAGNEEKINHHGKRADGIVKGMLQHSRSSTNEKELTDINVLADEYLRLAYHGLRAKDKSFNADFKTEFDESLPKIKVIPQDIGRVLLNLINNAFYACNERSRTAGTEKIGKENKSYKPVVTVMTFAKKNNVIIKVKDNGGGIPADELNKIFQPFFTTKPTGEGTGLGLSLSYDIITEGHGGELKVETKVGKGMPAGQTGTEFVIVLPIK